MYIENFIQIKISNERYKTSTTNFLKRNQKSYTIR